MNGGPSFDYAMDEESLLIGDNGTEETINRGFIEGEAIVVIEVKEGAELSDFTLFDDGADATGMPRSAQGSVGEFGQASISSVPRL